MFQGFSSYFNDLKVRQKLAFGFGALVLLTLLVGIVSFVSTAIQNNALERLQAAQDNTTVAQEINTQMLEARRREKDFLNLTIPSFRDGSLHVGERQRSVFHFHRQRDLSRSIDTLQICNLADRLIACIDAGAIYLGEQSEMIPDHVK